MCVCVCVCVRACVRACVRVRACERQTDRDTQRENKVYNANAKICVQQTHYPVHRHTEKGGGGGAVWHPKICGERQTDRQSERGGGGGQRRQRETHTKRETERDSGTTQRENKGYKANTKICVQQRHYPVHREREGGGGTVWHPKICGERERGVERERGGGGGSVKEKICVTI